MPPPLCHEVEEKDVVLGMRSPKNRSLLSVNEDFEGERNDKIHFLFSLFVCRYTPTTPQSYSLMLGH